MLRSAIAGLLAVVAGGCGGDGRGDSAARAKLVEELQSKRDAWVAEGPRSYVFVRNTVCFCDVEVLFGTRTVVRDGAVISAVSVATGLADEQGGLTALFQEAISASEENPESFDVVYDAEYGYLQHYSVDYDDDTQDDGATVGVSCFSPDVSDAECAAGLRTQQWCAATGGKVAEIDATDPRASCEPLSGATATDMLTPSGRIAGREAVCCLPYAVMIEVLAMEADQL
jgi:hypothetical protein